MSSPRILHVTNGDSVAGTLRETSLGGEVLAWREILYEGPLANVSPDEFRRLRADYLAGQGWGDVDDTLRVLESQDGLLEAAVRHRRPIVLWFEHDLFDQLQLLQILAHAREAAPGQIELVQAGDYLGRLDAPVLEQLWATREAVPAATIGLAAAAWEAVCVGAVEDALQLETSALPHLQAALRRLLEERQPLSRTKRQVLEALAESPRDARGLFAANQAAEEAVFLGDASFFLRLHELVEDGLVSPVEGELPEPPPRGEHAAFSRATLSLTSAGRAQLRA